MPLTFHTVKMSSHIYPFLFSFFWYVVSAQFTRTPTSVNGVLEYYGVAVDVYNPLPTLIYNCDNLAAICANVQEFLNDNPNVNLPLTLHYDSNSSRSGRRRGSSCPSSWQNSLVVNGISYSCGNYPGQPNVQPGNLPPIVGPVGNWQPMFFFEIPDAAQTGSSGMRFTCDEFPAAS
jgi:hypothetical protein